ncbi:MAG TPA: hypothetical protein VFD82_02700 [Planctomycetota bacterium]|nr:hypothetical protein [Planctomycetota bacterium]
MRFLLLLVVCLYPLTATPLCAQDDVLAVERAQDLRARDAASTLLRATRSDWNARAITPRDLCRLLTTASGDKVAFVAAAKGDAATTPFDLELKAATPLLVMAVTQLTTGLRFVWRSGVVFLVPKEEVRPLVLLVLYDLRAECAPLKSFPGPRLGLVPGGTEAVFPPEEDSGTTVSGFTAELIERLIKENVTPEAWATDSVSLTNHNGLFLVRQTPQGHREIARLLDQLGLVPLPIVRRVRR